MRGDLAVRLNDGTTDQIITAKTTGLKIRKTAPGGHADTNLHINLPRATFPDLGPSDRLYITDARTGHNIFDGYTTNPGTTTGPDGEGFDLSALGGQSRLSDQAQKLVYVDKQLTSWTQDPYGAQAPSGTAQSSLYPDGAGGLEGDPCLYLQFNPGQPVKNGGEIAMMYTGLDGAGMKIGGFVTAWDAGITDTGWLMSWNTWPYFTVNTQTTYTQAGSYFGVFAGGPYLDENQPRIAFRAIRQGFATNVSTDTVWAASGRVSVLGQLVDRYGDNLDMTTASHVVVVDAWVYAHEVVEDLLGRALTFCDPTTAVVGTTSYAIDQLAYVDGAKPMQVLDNLGEFEPDMVYLIGSTNAAGLHQFEYRAWPTKPRYVIPPSIPFEQPGGDIDQCNRIAVSWSWPDKDGTHQELEVVTAAVPALDEVGRVRDADPVTLPDGRGSRANAQRLGAQILAAKANPPKSGTCVVDRPILDLATGAMVSQWELEPGYLAQVMATGDVLRVTETEYDDDACATTMTLGEPILTDDQRIARLERVL